MLLRRHLIGGAQVPRGARGVVQYRRPHWYECNFRERARPGADAERPGGLWFRELRGQSEAGRVRMAGATFGGPLFSLFALPRPRAEQLLIDTSDIFEDARADEIFVALKMPISRTSPRAVDRNRVRRRVRNAAFEVCLRSARRQWDMVFLCELPAQVAPWPLLLSEMEQAVFSVGMWTEDAFAGPQHYVDLSNVGSGSGSAADKVWARMGLRHDEKWAARRERVHQRMLQATELGRRWEVVEMAGEEVVPR